MVSGYYWLYVYEFWPLRWMMTIDFTYELWLLNDLMTTKVNDDFWLYLWVLTAEWYNDH